LKTAGTIKLSSPATREFWEIPVLFEDEHLLALDKPAGLLTSPDRHDPQRPNLMTLLHAGIAGGKPWAREHQLNYLSNAHRPDFETTGVILLAKNKPALVALANLFSSEKPLKKYTALAQGNPPEEKFEVDAKLAPHPVRTGLMCVDPKNGKKSKTQFEVLERFSGWTLLRCLPLIERPHQIRAHLRHAGLPIAGDEIYGGKPLWLSRLKRDFRLKPGREERPLISRAALHAEEFQLPHPVTGEAVTITAPWPKDLKVAVKYLRQFAK
jgi:23S rRNA pseudouridine955/2504/2580 synthase/23S rRNA pseudouridine1911/1915/1917 synthase